VQPLKPRSSAGAGTLEAPGERWGPAAEESCAKGAGPGAMPAAWLPGLLSSPRGRRGGQTSCVLLQVSGAGGRVLALWAWLYCVGNAVLGHGFACCAQPFPFLFLLEKFNWSVSMRGRRVDVF